MPPISRKRAQKKALRSSSEEAISRTLGFIKRLHLPDGPWIGSTNRYTEDCIGTLKRDMRGVPTRINDRHLAKYIAASTVLHVADGWDMLGRAMESHTIRNIDAARHLGYYAELRAAMSLLASEGVGIFSRQHFVLNDQMLCEAVPQMGDGKDGTHEMAWIAMDHWSNLERSSELLSKIIKVGGKSLADWLGAFNHGKVWWDLHGSEWLKAWGIDIRYLARDKNARNASSYRPNRLKQKPILDQETTSAFILAFWQSMEPTPSAFEKLDKHLLRIALERGFEATTGNQPTDPAFATATETTLDSLGFTGLIKEELQRFMLRQIEPQDHQLISEAKLNDGPDHPRHHMQVLSRASILLRIATGAAEIHLHKGGVTSDDLKFWWKSLGEDRGLWDTANPPAALTDLWIDVENAISDIQGWESQNTVPRSFYGWRENCKSAIATLSTSERIIFWGLGL